MSHRIQTKNILPLLGLILLAAACAVTGGRSVEQHRWWLGLGPVLPHDTFPADCTLCHTGNGWNQLTEDFTFDHERETGVELSGAHSRAQCLRCHNDRGPVATFRARGCVGCHEDVHLGQLSQNCTDCHSETNWRPQGQIAMHLETRFPLVGVHAVTACRRCHPGSEVGKFVPTDPSCHTCHESDLQRAVNPPHIALGFTRNCNRCHVPRSWDQAEN